MQDKIDALLLRNARILVLRDEFVIASELVKVVAAELLQTNEPDEARMNHYDDCVEFMEACGWRYEQALHES